MTPRKIQPPIPIASETTPLLGARSELEGGFRPDALLFGESQARMIVSVRRRHLTRLREIARREDVPISVMGEVRGQRLEIGDLMSEADTTNGW